MNFSTLSKFDLLIFQIWPSLDKCVMVAKKELKYAGPFGLCLTLCGTIFLDRGSSESGRRAINEAGKKVA